MFKAPASTQRSSGLAQGLSVSLFSETSGCLSRSKASAQAQLSCGKVGGVENCFLSCLGHSLFMPGNPWPSGLGWVSVFLPGVHTCFLLLSRTEPNTGLPVTELSQTASCRALCGPGQPPQEPVLIFSSFSNPLETSRIWDPRREVHPSQPYPLTSPQTQKTATS